MFCTHRVRPISTTNLPRRYSVRRLVSVPAGGIAQVGDVWLLSEAVGGIRLNAGRLPAWARGARTLWYSIVRLRGHSSCVVGHGGRCGRR